MSFCTNFIQFQDLHRCHPCARNVFESEGAGEVTIESCPAFSGLFDDISENPGQVHCCWQIPVFNGPPQILKWHIYIYLFILFSLLGSTYMCGVTMERSLSGFDWTLFRTQFCILHVNMLPFCWYMGSIFSPHPPSPSTYTLLHTRTWGHLIKPPCLFPNAFYLCFSKSNHTWEFKIKQRLSWSHHWFCRIRAAVSADCTVSKVASRRKAQDTHTRTHCGKWLGAE